MRVNFRQGLVSSAIDGNGQPTYLTVNGTGITLSAANRPVVFTLASGTKNYTVAFYQTVLAWPISMLSSATEAWLYVELNSASSARTYGITTVAPSYGSTAPTSPVDNQMWFDTTTNTMKAFSAATNGWLIRLRIVAGHYTTTALTTVPFGSQVAITSASGFTSGSIMVDGFGVAIKDSKGDFVTTEDVLLIDGASTYAAKLEGNVTTTTANEPIAAFHVISYTNDGLATPADYEDIGSKIVGLSTNDANTGEAVNVVLAGKVHNPLWNWGSANVTLWVDTNGQLVAYDPFTQGTGRTVQHVPIARSIDSTTIIFDQGLGGVGEKGADGSGASISKATTTTLGTVKISVAPTDSANPIAVGINDPILTSPKVPLDHTHPATAITVSPFGTFSGANVQLALEYLQLQKLGITGGTISGNIISSVQATADTHLVPLGQVKTLIAATALKYIRYTLLDSATNLVVGFNALTTAQRTFNTSTVVIVEYQSAVYIYSGPVGTPAIATSVDNFLLISTIPDVTLSVTPYTLTAYPTTDTTPPVVVNVVNTPSFTLTALQGTGSSQVN